MYIYYSADENSEKCALKSSTTLKDSKETTNTQVSYQNLIQLVEIHNGRTFTGTCSGTGVDIVGADTTCLDADGIEYTRYIITKSDF